MRKQLGFFTVFIVLNLLIIIIFILYFINNIKPCKKQFDFENSIRYTSFINNYRIEKNNGRIAIYFETNSEIFKEYNYHSYISGNSTGRKIDLQTFLVSEDNTIIKESSNEMKEKYHTIMTSKSLEGYAQVFVGLTIDDKIQSNMNNNDMII